MYKVSRASLAHPGKRYQAQFLDALISVLLFVLILYASRSFGLEGWGVDILVFTIPFGYFSFSDALPNGQSLGKKPFGIRVISRKTGKPCNLWQSFVRNAFSPVFGVIDALLIFGADRMRLGDIFANTAVVKKF